MRPLRATLLCGDQRFGFVCGMATTAKPQVLVKNETVLAFDITEKQLLNDWPRGAYTTARTVGYTKVLEFQLHVQRLLDSAKLMMGATEQFSTTPAILGSAALLRPYVVRSVAAGLRAFHTAFPQCLEERRITCLLTWDGPPDDAAGAAAPGWPVDFQLYTHIHPLPPRPSPPIRVDIRGAPRGNAKAKDSQWVKERKGLEALMGPGVNEILLVDEGGHILEGTQTNFFAVLEGRVHTAGEGILEGSIRQMVLEGCAQAGIGVVLSPPNVADVARWEGAFVTSTSRLVLPIDVLGLPEGIGSEGESDVRRFPDQPLTRRIVDLVARKLDADSIPIEGAPAVAPAALSHQVAAAAAACTT